MYAAESCYNIIRYINTVPHIDKKINWMQLRQLRNEKKKMFHYYIYDHLYHARLIYFKSELLPRYNDVSLTAHYLTILGELSARWLLARPSRDQ